MLTPSSFLNSSMSLTVAQDISYSTSSAVHGLALHPSGKFIYAADDTANQIWTHSINSTTGLLTLVDTTAAPVAGSDPRHVAVSANGAYLYAVFEGTNEVGVFAISNSTGLPVYQNVTYPLILSSKCPSSLAPKTKLMKTSPRRNILLLLVRRSETLLLWILPMGDLSFSRNLFARLHLSILAFINRKD